MPYYHKKYTEEEKKLDNLLCDILMTATIVTGLICFGIELVRQIYGW